MFAAVVALAGIGRASAADVIDRVMAVVNRQPILLSDQRERAIAGAFANDLVTVALH